MAGALGVAPSQVRATHPALSEDVEEFAYGAIDYAVVLVRDGQSMGVDAVCRAIQAAAADVGQRYTFELDE